MRRFYLLRGMCMQDDRKYCVYRHTSPTGKVYVGITCQNPIRRWAHGHGYRMNQYFSNAIRKYGWDNFTHEILYSDLTKKEACELEIELIRFHRSNNEDCGYNLSSGGDAPGAGCKHSEEARTRISESKKGEKHPYYGKKLSEEHRLKMSEAHKGYRPTPEECRQRSERQVGEKNHNYGKHPSEETRNKMRESHRQYTIVQMDMDGVVIATFPSTREAARTIGGHATSIAAVCRGKHKSAAGYKWKYEQI